MNKKNLLDNNLSWQALNLPEGLSLVNGVLSGTPTVAGSFNVSVSVANSLGEDTKNIQIKVISRDTFPILQDNSLIKNVSMADLIAEIQNGTAQKNYVCGHSQMAIYLTHPINGNLISDVRLNFCDFRNVILSDGSVTQGLILQFDKALWNGFAPFDFNNFNRWKYSHLRRWLNSNSDNWFSPAYSNDSLPSSENTSYATAGIKGFLAYLPSALADNLSAIRIHTAAFFDDLNDDDAIDDPDFLNGVDYDATFDKVFIPSISQMKLSDDTFEGSSWAYSSNRFLDLDGNSCNLLSRSANVENKIEILGVDSSSHVQTITASNSSYSPAPAFVLC